MTNALNDLSFDQILDAIFTAYTEKADIPLYGEDYYETLGNLQEHLSKEYYFDLEGKLGLATSAIAFNGFRAGFQHAITLLLGDTGKLLGTGGAKDV